jgi:hypothetical protein
MRAQLDATPVENRGRPESATADAGGLADCAAVSAGSVSQAGLAPAPWLPADGTGSSWARSVRSTPDLQTGTLLAIDGPLAARHVRGRDLVVVGEPPEPINHLEGAFDGRLHPVPARRAPE